MSASYQGSCNKEGWDSQQGRGCLPLLPWLSLHAQALPAETCTATSPALTLTFVHRQVGPKVHWVTAEGTEGEADT